jgi:hypothetical protein
MRPRLIALVAWLFIVVGAGGILKDVLPLLGPGASAAREGLLVEGVSGLALIWFVRLLAVVGGVAVLRRRNWGRWLLAAWMAFHIVVSLFHSPLEAAAHLAIFAVLACALFLPQASTYFAHPQRPPSART